MYISLCGSAFVIRAEALQSSLIAESVSAVHAMSLGGAMMAVDVETMDSLAASNQLSKVIALLIGSSGLQSQEQVMAACRRGWVGEIRRQWMALRPSSCRGHGRPKLPATWPGSS